MKELLSGNESIARGAWEAGISCAFGYPGTPSTEILETLVKYPDVYCEWSPNAKVALEAAAGAAIAGARSMVTMKHVGLNVAADPMMTLSYIGVVGGMVIVVCDDPGQHSSQTEQDTRHYARLAKIPILEPGSAVEAREYMLEAFDLSERYRVPVIVRSTTCVSHSRMLVSVEERRAANPVKFVKNDPQFVPLPLWGRTLRRGIEKRMEQQSLEASVSKLNTCISGGNDLGIISCGVAANHARDIFPEASFLKLGWSWPFPDKLIQEFSSKVHKVLVLEEGDPILEEHVKSLGISCRGKDIVPRCGELTPSRIKEVRARLEGMDENRVNTLIPQPVAQAADLPGRPPILCAGCPHRGLFFALTKYDVVVCGDIGCYSLGVFPPLNRTDVILCMGGGFTLAHGMQKAGEPRKIVGIVGDSTFYHSGITGLLDIVYNRGASTLIVVDNRTTAMTGHQDHPGTGKTLMGDSTVSASIEAIAKACGIEQVRVINPYDTEESVRVIGEELETNAPSLIISRAPCVLNLREAPAAPLTIDQDKCRNCRACLKLGCPAIESAGNEKPLIRASACPGCGLCINQCKFGAIRTYDQKARKR